MRCYFGVEQYFSIIYLHGGEPTSHLFVIWRKLCDYRGRPILSFSLIGDVEARCTTRGGHLRVQFGSYLQIPLGFLRFYRQTLNWKPWLGLQSPFFLQTPLWATLGWGYQDLGVVRKLSDLIQVHTFWEVLLSARNLLLFIELEFKDAWEKVSLVMQNVCVPNWLQNW